MKNISIAQYHNFHWYYLIRNDIHGCTYFRISPRMFSSHDEWDFDESGTEKKKKERRVCSKCKSRIPLFASFPHREATRLKESSPATISKSAQIFTIRRSRLSVRLPRHVSFPFREESAYFIPRGVQTVFSASTSLRAPRLLSVPQFSTSPLQRLESPTIGKSRASFHSIISINASN